MSTLCIIPSFTFGIKTVFPTFLSFFLPHNFFSLLSIGVELALVQCTLPQEMNLLLHGTSFVPRTLILLQGDNSMQEKDNDNEKKRERGERGGGKDREREKGRGLERDYHRDLLEMIITIGDHSSPN